jgi:hypothetical protein
MVHSQQQAYRLAVSQMISILPADCTVLGGRASSPVPISSSVLLILVLGEYLAMEGADVGQGAGLREHLARAL